SVKINVQKKSSEEEMNISPADASQAPYGASGEVVDRMQGTLPGGNGGAKKSLFDGPSKKSPPDAASKDLKKKAGKKTSSNDDDVKKQGPASGEEGDAPKDVKPEKKRRSRKKWKKPRDKPNRPLSAYNLFFQKERASMLGNDAKDLDADKGKKRIHRKTHGKIGFAEMARIIGAKWKTLNDDEKTEFTEVAAKEKKRYAEELAVWKEDQKKKEEAAKKSAKSSKGSKQDDAKDDGFTPEQQMQIRMQMMANSTRGGFPFMGNDGQQGTIGYLRAMQEERAAMFGGGGGGGGGGNNSSQQQFPNASEASANALLNQFQGMPPVGAGMDVSGSGGMSDFQQFQQMARMQMMNSSMMGGPMGVGMMGGMGMGGGFPPMGDLEFQRFQQMRMMQGMNQMDGSNSGMSGSNDTNQSGTGNSNNNNNMDAAMMRRFQSRFGGM
ncbi:MAG: hypothetical protein SGILL_006125, partial [Bacillariaceae sp.]